MVSAIQFEVVLVLKIDEYEIPIADELITDDINVPLQGKKA